MLSLGIQGKGLNFTVGGYKAPSEATPSKEVNDYRTAPFPGWTEVKERLAKNYDPVRAEKEIEDMEKEWNGEYRNLLNLYYEETGGRDAVCARYALKGITCPEEDFLNLRFERLLKEYLLSPSPWAYAEIVSTFEDIKRKVGAIKRGKGSESGKRPIRFQVARINETSARKPFAWDDGVVLLDGTNWNTTAVAASTAYEYNPTVVAVGGADTLVFAFNVSDCNSWCPGTTTNECVVVGHSYDRGQTMNLDLCLYSSSTGLGEAAIGADPYRKVVYVAYSYVSSLGDYDIGVYRAHISDLFATGTFSTAVSYFSDDVTPYVNVEFNWGEPACAGQDPATCACTAFDNWVFIGYNSYDLFGTYPSVERSTDCGQTWASSYVGASSNGSAYTSPQIMLETTNDVSSSSSVCASSNGGDNTIQGVFVDNEGATDHEIWHIYTDASQGWGNTWTTTQILDLYPNPINQPWLSVSRNLTNANMTHLVLFESQFSATDGDIRGLYGMGLPPASWSLFNVDYTAVDSRTPTVHTDARWQWCPGATTATASYFHTAFYHKCPNTYDGSLCSEPYSSYNNTFRVAVMRAPWSSPTSWGPEYCVINLTYADTIAIPPPPAFDSGGVWQNWWQINGTTFRANPTTGAAWWFGALWVYKWSPTDYDLEWTILQCLLGSGDDDLAVGEARENVANMIVTAEGRSIVLRGEGRAEVYSLSGRLVSETDVRGTVKIPLSSGTYFVKTPDGVRRVIVR